MRESNTMNRLNVIGGCTKAASSFSSTLVSGPFSIFVSSLSSIRCWLCVSVLLPKTVRHHNTLCLKLHYPSFPNLGLCAMHVWAVSLEGGIARPRLWASSPEITHFGDRSCQFGFPPFPFRGRLP